MTGRVTQTVQITAIMSVVYNVKVCFLCVCSEELKIGFLKKLQSSIYTDQIVYFQMIYNTLIFNVRGDIYQNIKTAPKYIYCHNVYLKKRSGSYPINVCNSLRKSRFATNFTSKTLQYNFSHGKTKKSCYLKSTFYIYLTAV